MARVWQPEAGGRYVSRALGIALEPDGDVLRVYDAQGRPVPYDYEKADVLATQAREIEELRAELAHMRTQVLAPVNTDVATEVDEVDEAAILTVIDAALRGTPPVSDALLDERREGP